MESFSEITKIIHTYIDNFDYQKYFYNSMNKLINKYIENNDLDKCVITFATNYYFFDNLGYFYDYSINNTNYLRNIKKLDKDTKKHILDKGIKVLYKTYSNQIIELINLNLINELFKNISVIKKYNYSFDTFKDNSKILQHYLEKVYKKQFFNKV